MRKEKVNFFVLHKRDREREIGFRQTARGKEERRKRRIEGERKKDRLKELSLKDQKRREDFPSEEGK